MTENKISNVPTLLHISAKWHSAIWDSANWDSAKWEDTV